MDMTNTATTVSIIRLAEKIHQIDPKFVPNLPYEKVIKNVLIPNGTEFTTIYDGDHAMLLSEVPLTLVAGYTYKVLFDGVFYECIAREISIGSSTLAVIGNSAIAPLWETNSEGNGEPFYIIPFNSEGLALITPTAGTYYIGITEYASEIHKLDEKFIPIVNPD
jgi:hypothetical protein